MKNIKFKGTPTPVFAGFTLIELLVSISIATLVMSVVFFGYRIFSNRLAVASASQEVAVAIRQAQTYGISGKEVASGGGSFDTAYGVSFDLNDPQSYYIFADKNNNGVYDDNRPGCASNNELVEKGTMRNAVNLSQVCGTNAAGVESCSISGANALQVMFKRPSPDAKISFVNSSCNVIPATYKSAKITVAIAGEQSTVAVSEVGQVIVTPACSTSGTPCQINPGAALCLASLDQTVTPNAVTYGSCTPLNTNGTLCVKSTYTLPPGAIMSAMDQTQLMNPYSHTYFTTPPPGGNPYTNPNECLSGYRCVGVSNGVFSSRGCPLAPAPAM